VLPLVRHPSAPAAGYDVSALAERGPDGDLRLRWVVRGTLAGIRVPPPGPLRRGDRLWEHTCVEAFVAAAGSSAYVELNVSPAREWAAYGFARYREGEPLATATLEPGIVVRRNADTLAIDVLVALADLSSTYPRAALRIGLAAVVEASDGGLSYWALGHPASRPDFHHADGFTLRLPLPGATPARTGAPS